MIEAFRELYGSADGVRVFRAPGRVNLIGEHTDYNLGFVMPMALQLATYIAAAPSNDGKLRIYSEDKRELREFDVAGIANAQPARAWTDYVIGVAKELAPISGANLLIRSTVPEGSGLSSSAALEVSSALALACEQTVGQTIAFCRLPGALRAPEGDLTVAGQTTENDPASHGQVGLPHSPGLELAKLCQRAERNFVGMPCGIMDQYISVFGRQHAAVEIDCRSLAHRAVTLPEGAAFIAVNTMVKHELSGSAYRDRVAECAAAASAMNVDSLRDATVAQLEANAQRMSETVYRRARHVITEDDRVNRFVDAGARGDLAAMGKLMVESHRSLQNDYEVSCAELDFLVDTALAMDGVYGSRMTGGGFGGCTVTMLRPQSVTSFRERVATAYGLRFGIEAALYDCIPSPGAAEVKNFETIPARR